MLLTHGFLEKENYEHKPEHFANHSFTTDKIYQNDFSSIEFIECFVYK